MSSPKHIQRDGTHISPYPGTAVVAYGLNDIGVLPAIAGTRGGIDYDYGWVTANEEITIPDGGYALIGVVIDPPRKDRIPYRVKASVFGQGAIILGEIRGATGSPVSVQDVRPIPFRDSYDDLLIIEPNYLVDDGDYNPIFIGVATYDEDAGVTAVRRASQISVQNLGIKPPTMQNAVS